MQFVAKYSLASGEMQIVAQAAEEVASAPACPVPAEWVEKDPWNYIHICFFIDMVTGQFWGSMMFAQNVVGTMCFVSCWRVLAYLDMRTPLLWMTVRI
eukprot:2814767-Amphidinium_carterae.1